MDPGIKRLRWVMIATLLGDLTVTFAGQPASYWRNLSTVTESNRYEAILELRRSADASGYSFRSRRPAVYGHRITQEMVSDARACGDVDRLGTRQEFRTE